MTPIEAKFSRLGTEHAPGQEIRQAEQARVDDARGDDLPGTPVDFSHGDVNDSAFIPTPGSLEVFVQGVERGGEQAYTEYRGGAELRDLLAERLGVFTGCPVSGSTELIITPGTQGGLFLAIASTVTAGDRVAIVRPDYFANRKLVEFFGAEVVPLTMDYIGTCEGSGLDLSQLEQAFQSGVRVFLFSNPNNPTGVVYSRQEIERIAALANEYDAIVIVDQLYSRLLFEGGTYTHLRASQIESDKVLTIMGPSKTESLSGYRLGVAFGAKHLIDRMEKLQAIVSLRAPGYSQAVLRTWFAEPEGWMADRIHQHQAIRDDLLAVLAFAGIEARAPAAGSYLFPRLPKLAVDLHAFVHLLRRHTGVIVTPGTEFDPSRTDSIRLNFSQNHRAAVQAVERIVQFVRRFQV